MDDQEDHATQDLPLNKKTTDDNEAMIQLMVNGSKSGHAGSDVIRKRNNRKHAW